MVSKRTFFHITIAALPLLLVSLDAHAVPSFARQTGLPCASCHTVFPELTPFGRSFKMNGYTLTGIKQVEAKASASAAGLKVNEIPPLSAMLQTDVTTNQSAPNGDTYMLPDQLSFFFAGEITPHMGSFIQMTMPQGGGFGMDNTDIRYANHSGSLTYGITLNNNPTVQDLWNSTPAWGYPFTGGAGITQPLVADGDTTGGNVAGLGAYADWGNGLYAELTLYRPTALLTDPSPFSGGSGNMTINGMAPYGRVAYQMTFDNGNSLMVGAYGMKTDLYDTVAPGGTDSYTDTALDTQYEMKVDGNDMLSIHGSYTNEAQDLGAGGGSHSFNALRLDAIYHWGYHATAALAYANNSGDISESWTTVQYSYLPWQNTKFTAQYVMDNNNSNNNAGMLQAWLMW
jgi:hypothetical protein